MTSIVWAGLANTDPEKLAEIIKQENAKETARRAANEAKGKAPAASPAPLGEWKENTPIGPYVSAHAPVATQEISAPAAATALTTTTAVHKAPAHPAHVKVKPLTRAEMREIQGQLESVGFHTQGDRYQPGQPFDGLRGTNTDSAVKEAKRVLNVLNPSTPFAETAEITPEFKTALAAAVQDKTRFASALAISKMTLSELPLLPSAPPAPVSLAQSGVSNGSAAAGSQTPAATTGLAPVVPAR